MMGEISALRHHPMDKLMMLWAVCTVIAFISIRWKSGNEKNKKNNYFDDDYFPPRNILYYICISPIEGAVFAIIALVGLSFLGGNLYIGRY